MLQLSASLLNKPVLSLRTGGPVATAVMPIFNPNNLKIEGFYCDVPGSSNRLVLVYQDIREVSAQGFIVDDADVLIEPEELVRLKAILELNFELLGKQVCTQSKQKLGKVSDYAVETTTMYVQKLYVSQSLLKSFTGGSLSVDRTQVIEITNRRVIIQDPLQGTPATATASI
jgi:sporulation protein YlmC with PRC-barrel domain